MTTRRRLRTRARRLLAVLACVVASAVLVLAMAGDVLTGRTVVTDGLESLRAEQWDQAGRVVWTESRSPLDPGVDEVLAAVPEARSGDCYLVRRVEDRGRDLFRLRRTPGGYGPLEPLFELNTAADEADPVVIDDGRRLVFASDRPGGLGGFDLYVADLDGDRIGAPKRLPEPLNGASDDRAASFDARGERIVFASSRRSEDGVRSELFATAPRGDSFEEPVPLTGLLASESSDFRSPALSPDGRWLLFASDAAGAGDYDLYRSAFAFGRFHPAERLVEIATPRDELAPVFDGGGAGFFFVRQDAVSADRASLRRAERNELARLRDENPDLVRRLLVLLAGVLLALLLSWLLLQWSDLHPFVKFLIVSAIIHLLILLYVHTRESRRSDDGEGGPAFVVSYLPSDESGEASQRGGSTVGDGALPAARAEAPVSPSESAPLSSTPEATVPASADLAAREVVPTDEAEKAGAAERSAVTHRRLREPEVAEEASARSKGADPTLSSLIQDAAATLAERANDAAADTARFPVAERPAEAASAAPARPEASGGAQRSAGPAARDDAPSAEFASRGRIPAPAREPSATRAVASEATPALAGGDPAASSMAPGPTRSLPERSATASGAVGERGSATSLAAEASPTPPAPGSAGPRERAVLENLEATDAPAAVAGRSTRSTGAPSLGRSASAASEAGAAVARSAAPASDPLPATQAVGPRALEIGRTKGVPGPMATTIDAAPGSPGEPSMPREALDVLAARGRPGARLESELLAGGVPERSSARSVTGPSRLASSRRASEKDTPGTGDAKAPRASGAAESSEVAEIAREARPLAPARRGTEATTPASAPGASLALVASASTAPSPGDFLRSRAYRGDAELAVAAPPTAYAQRVGAGRLEALKLGGGSDETEAAVLAGLRYLAKRQRRSGAFAAQSSHDKYGDFRIGKTGLALLAFLGSGYTQHTPGEFQPTIEAALSFLLREQDRLSGHFGDSEAYGHGIATYALAEAFAMTKDPRLERPLARAVQRILAAQVTTGPAELRGGFGYYYADPERRFDRWPRLSVTVWQIMALKSARLAGIEIPERAFTMVKDFVLRAYDQELAAFRYNHDPDWLASAYPTLPGSNAATLFALELLGVPERDPLRQRALQYVLERRPARTWRPASNRDFATRGLGNLYYLYYASLGLYCQGGEVWQAWNAEMTRLLVPNQARDGSWKPISYYAEYCGDTDDDRVYTTALCVLTLEVYYRYFTPLLTSVGPPGAPAGAAPR